MHSMACALVVVVLVLCATVDHSHGKMHESPMLVASYGAGDDHRNGVYVQRFPDFGFIETEGAVMVDYVPLEGRAFGDYVRLSGSVPLNFRFTPSPDTPSLKGCPVHYFLYGDEGGVPLSRPFYNWTTRDSGLDEKYPYSAYKSSVRITLEYSTVVPSITLFDHWDSFSPLWFSLFVELPNLGGGEGPPNVVRWAEHVENGPYSGIIAKGLAIRDKSDMFLQRWDTWRGVDSPVRSIFELDSNTITLAFSLYINTYVPLPTPPPSPSLSSTSLGNPEVTPSPPIAVLAPKSRLPSVASPRNGRTLTNTRERTPFFEDFWIVFYTAVLVILALLLLVNTVRLGRLRRFNNHKSFEDYEEEVRKGMYDNSDSSDSDSFSHRETADWGLTSFAPQSNMVFNASSGSGNELHGEDIVIGDTNSDIHTQTISPHW